MTPLAAAAGLGGSFDRYRSRVSELPEFSGELPTAALAEEIQDFVKTGLAAHLYPREVEFVDALPMTATGKIQRRLLRQG